MSRAITPEQRQRIVLFMFGIPGFGGAERLMFEEARHFQQQGIETYVVTARCRDRDFFRKQFPDIAVIEVEGPRGILSRIPFLRYLLRLFRIRQTLQQLKPDLILGQYTTDGAHLYLLTFLTGLTYALHVHATIFWFPEAHPLLKYALIHRGIFDRIWNSIPGHQEFIPRKAPRAHWLKRVLSECQAILLWLGVRKAVKVFVLSNRMRLEVELLYDRPAIVAQGAFPAAVLSQSRSRDIKKELRLEDHILILNVNRLDVRKRVDLAIRGFRLVAERMPNAVLAIGGTGPERERLEELARQLGLGERVIFLGFIPETELFDHYASCDVFIHPNWADYAMAPLEALAAGAKVVWSSEMDVDDDLLHSGLVFVADPTEQDMAGAIMKALNSDCKDRPDLLSYTWEHYFERIINELEVALPIANRTVQDVGR